MVIALGKTFWGTVHLTFCLFAGAVCSVKAPIFSDFWVNFGMVFDPIFGVLGKFGMQKKPFWVR